MSYIKTHMRSIYRLISCVAIATLLIVANSVQAQEGDFGEATEKASSDTKKFFSYFTDWVMLSHIHRSGENAAQVDNLFNSFLKDYASNPILQEVLNAFSTGELGSSSEAFFQQTGIRLYFVGNIDISKSDPRFEPVLSLLNESLNAKIKTPSSPYIIVTNNLSGSNDAGYKITTIVRYSDEIKAGKYNLDKSDSSNPFMASLNPSASRRNEAGKQIKEAMMAGISSLSENVKENYLPNLMLAFRDKVYKSGETIEAAVTKDGSITLEALNKELLAPNRTVEWSISPDNDQSARAAIEGNKLTFPTETGGEFAILAGAGSDEVNVTLKIQGLGQDLKDFLKKLLLEALKPRLEAAIQQQSNLKGDSTEASSSVVTNIKNVENANFPLEGEGQELTVLQEPTVLTDTSVFAQSEVRTNAFKSLRRKKNLVKRLQKAYQLVSYINKVLDENDQEVKDLVDALVENSGELLAQFVITGLSKNDSTAMKDMVANFLDDNLGDLAGTSGESAFATFLEPIDAPRGLPSGYNQGDNYYISPLVPLEDRDQIIANIAAYHSTQQTPTFVVINYSQDVSMESYLARAPTGAPKGLATGQDYVVINYVNIPGSVVEVFTGFGTGNTQEVYSALGGSATANQGLIGDDIASRLKKLHDATGYEYLAILHCESCEDETSAGPVNLPETPDIFNISESDWNIEFPTIKLPGQNGAKVPLIADKAEYVSKNAQACFIIYFRPEGDRTEIQTNLEFFSGDAEEDGLKIEPQLTVFDKNNQFNQINCNGQMGTWGKVICPSENANAISIPQLDSIYFDNLLTQVEICLSQENSSYASRISNFTSGRLALADEKFIYELYGGQKSIGDRHRITAHLIITDSYSSEAQMAEATAYEPKDGEYVIWVHQNREGLWEYKSSIPESVQEYFDLTVPNPDKQDEPWYSMDNMLSYLGAGAQALDDIATGLYEGFDWLGKGVRQARIPSYVWDCDDPSYDERYSQVYHYMTYPMNVFQNLLREQLVSSLDADQIDPKWASCLEKFKKGQVDFAFQAGLYNGLVEIVGSVFDLGKYISGLGSSQGRADFDKFLDQLARFQKEGANGELECTGTWCAITTGLEEQFDPTKCCQFVELVGEIVGPIVISIFLPNAAAAVAETTAGRVLLQAVKVFTWLDRAGDPFQFIGGGLRYLGRGVSVIRSKTNKLLIRIENEIIKAKVLTEQGIIDWNKSIDAVELVTANGYLAIRETSDAATSRGYRVVSGELADLASKLTNKGARLTKITQLSEVVDDLGSLLNRVDKMGLQDAELNAFLDDLINSTSFRNDITGISVVDGTIDRITTSWKLLGDLSSSRAWVRQNLKILEKFASIDETQKAGLKDFYKSFNPNGPYPTTRNGIEFDDYGFARFPDNAIAPISKNKYVSNALDGAVDGSKKDYEKAAKWFVDNNPNAQLATGGQGIVVDGKYYTMHHMEDGLTMMPVLRSVHLTSHTGGASLIRNGLKGIFNLP